MNLVHTAPNYFFRMLQHYPPSEAEVFWVFLFLQIFQQKPYKHFSPLSLVQFVPPTPSSFIWSLKWNLVMNANHEAHMQFFAASCYIIPVRSKYLPSSEPILIHPYPVFSFNMTDHVSHPHKTSSEVTVLCILNFTFFHNEQKDSRFWT